MNSERTPPRQIITSSDFIERLITNSEVYQNVSQKFIITTEDKLRLCLSEHLKQLEKKRSWVAPLGILITIIVTLVTSNFKKVGLDAATWQAIFIIAGLIALGWFIYSVKEAWQSEKIEDIIDELKKDSQPRTTS